MQGDLQLVKDRFVYKTLPDIKSHARSMGFEPGTLYLSSQHHTPAASQTLILLSTQSNRSGRMYTTRPCVEGLCVHPHHTVSSLLAERAALLSCQPLCSTGVAGTEMQAVAMNEPHGPRSHHADDA